MITKDFMTWFHRLNAFKWLFYFLISYFFQYCYEMLTMPLYGLLYIWYAYRKSKGVDIWRHKQMQGWYSQGQMQADSCIGDTLLWFGLWLLSKIVSKAPTIWNRFCIMWTISVLEYIGKVGQSTTYCPKVEQSGV